MAVQRRVVPILQKAPDTAVPAAVYGDTFAWPGSTRPVNGELTSNVRQPTGPESAGWSWEHATYSTSDPQTVDNWILQSTFSGGASSNYGITNRAWSVGHREMMPDLFTADHWVETQMSGGGWDAEEVFCALRMGPFVQDVLPASYNFIGFSQTKWGMPGQITVIGAADGSNTNFNVFPGINASDRLRLEAEGDVLRFFVNDVQQGADMTGATGWTGTRCGLTDTFGAYDGANTVFRGGIRCGTLPYTPPP